MAGRLKRLVAAATSHVSFYQLENAAAATTRWQQTIHTLMDRKESDTFVKSRLLQSEQDEDTKKGNERLLEETAFLVENLNEKRRLQLLDAGAEALLTPEQLTRLAARRVGLEVPENFGDVSAASTAASAETLQLKLREKLDEAEALGSDDTDEGKLREKRIRAIAEKAQHALSAEKARRSTKK